MVKNSIYVIFLVVFILSCGSPQDKTNDLSTFKETALLSTEKDTILANQDLKVFISHLDSQYPSLLLFQQSMMTSTFLFDKGKDSVVQVLDSTFTSKSGVVLLQLVQNEKIIQEKKIYIKPDKAYRFIESYIGPRGVIVASGQDVMTLGIPTDKFDNPVSEGTPVEYRFLRPNLELQKAVEPIKHLISYKIVNPQEKKGKTIAGISCGSANSNEKEFNEEAGWATAVRLDTINYQPLADNRQFFSVKTLPILDRLGNLIVDGTSVVFYVNDEKNTISHFASVAVNGISEALIQNPPNGGKLTIYAACGGVVSESKSVVFQRTFNDFSVVYDKGNQEIVAGPIIAGLTQYIPEGTAVVFEIYKNERLFTKYERQSVKGIAVLKLSDLFLNKGKILIKVAALEAKGQLIFDNK